MKLKDVDMDSLIAPNEEDVDGDEEVTINEGEELDYEPEPMKMAKDPGQPTTRQIEEHRKFHIPFRSLC